MEWNMFFIVFGTTTTTLTGIQKNPVAFESRAGPLRQSLRQCANGLKTVLVLEEGYN